MHLAAGMARVDGVDIAIAPGKRTPRGWAVVEAVWSGVGKPFAMPVEGCRVAGYGWQAPTRAAMPGLSRRWLALHDAPDYDLLPRLRPEIATVRFRAGLELGALHLPVWGIAQLVRIGILASGRPLAGLGLRFARALERFG